MFVWCTKQWQTSFQGFQETPSGFQPLGLDTPTSGNSRNSASSNQAHSDVQYFASRRGKKTVLRIERQLSIQRQDILKLMYSIKSEQNSCVLGGGNSFEAPS